MQKYTEAGSNANKPGISVCCAPASVFHHWYLDVDAARNMNFLLVCRNCHWDSELHRGRLSRHVPGFTKLKSASTKLERKDMRARSSACIREGGEVHKNKEAQKNEECRKIKTARSQNPGPFL